MKSLVELLALLVQECMRKSGAPSDRDVETLRGRVKHEGDSFITIALPAYCQDFERCLAAGGIVPGTFCHFGKLRSGVPEFLQGLLHNVFDKQTGRLLERPSVDCIKYVRQICLACKKILRPCSDARLADAAERYAACDDEVAVGPIGDTLHGVVEEVSAIIIGSMPLLRDGVFIDHIAPKHGPGATRESIMGNQKWIFRRWHKRLNDAGITWRRFAQGQGLNRMVMVENEQTGEWSLELSEPMPHFVDPVDEEPVRVVFVPKTLKSPRVIAVEPVCMQFAQQGLGRLLMAQSDRCVYTEGHVNFRDQSVNQELALGASSDGRLATLDMSDASDRVSLWHVHALLDAVPEFRKAVMACRSTRAELPDGAKIALEKFASMGSALCFPVEALVFFTSIIASRLHRAGESVTAESVYAFSRSVYVYGDDLIVPAGEAPAICDDLEALGFKVNRRKSFWTGKFRESCGSDCYDKVDVTPVYVRRDLPTSRKDASGICSAVSTANQLWSAGYTETALALRKAVERVTGKLPVVPANSPAIGWCEHSEVAPTLRWNRDLHCREQRCWVAVSPRDEDAIDGGPALAKCYRIIGREAIDLEHLTRSSRRYGLTLKRRWVPLHN